MAEDIRQLMEEAESSTAHKDGMALNIAVNYGGRHELIQAMRCMAEAAVKGRLSPEEITEGRVAEYLFIPPDSRIRT